MGVRFACHACNKQLNIKESLAGKRGKCPRCGVRFRIPTEDREFSLRLEDATGEENGADSDSGGVAEEEPAAETPASPTPQPSQPSQPSRQPQSSHQPQLDQSPQTTPAAAAAEPPFDPLEDPLAQWYVRPASGGQYGPADGSTVRQWISEGRLTSTTLLWRDGWTEWREAVDVLPQTLAQKLTAPQAGSRASEPQAAVSPPPPPPAEPLPTEPLPTDSPSASAAPAPHASVGEGAATDASDSPASTAEAYLGARRQRKQRQRAVLIGVLVAASLLLIVALVVAMGWPR